ncbi:MAG: hypothetical protein A2289_08280 [Deltaproteobacteria bacterium RIFOXYA12_FULL_58_15]|nr:MAG: hypothetical protein A2289_08280 [Deltaproteobacteria bacterium RIFOXYA12_FULL_58_15]OGR09118.1 MAG: hypothetical protein A2341_10895 [Deltaproteobacteria bacterium RIFOXYB12_FULL_58_9]
MADEATRNKVLEWIIKNAVEWDDDIEDSENLFESGVLDSFDVPKFLVFLEDEFHVTFEDKHLVDDRMTSIGGLTAIIGELLAENLKGQAPAQ